jgi:hypothetical protein
MEGTGHDLPPAGAHRDATVKEMDSRIPLRSPSER